MREAAFVDEVRRALLRWFRAGHRDMPWRRSRDPYAIWVSEIMLQQTRVETVRPYFSRWMARFPTVAALAAAPLDDVLQQWAGLGYYARARNLHTAARAIVERHDGRFPDAETAVRALPGVGPYTAGAILSIAFGQPAPILDGNVQRVLARLYRVEGAVDDAGARRTLWALAARLVPADAAGDFNQALMELGATLCTPRAPSCLVCPLATLCAARAGGVQETLPAPKQRAAPRVVEMAAVTLQRWGRLLVARRPPAGLWGGLWEPPTGGLAAGETAAAAALRVVRETTGLGADRLTAHGHFDHELTHRRMRFHAFVGVARGRIRLHQYQAARWLAPDELASVGLAAWTQRLFRENR